ncbi:hypothetical protein [Lysinibacillus xylanilyticus]|uniref:hypothetical protein n=1 Tax=Lysinibacillus xylanilyticus TaxID=582475 RepID=UPI00069CFD9D|nr:hypothetical protein [Lysinibacillus xylanilyticus]
MLYPKTKLFTALGMSAALLVGAGSAYATQKKEINEPVETVNSMKEPTPEEIQKVLEGKPTPSNIKVEGLFSLNGKPDYTADFYLNDENLLSLLKINAQELKQELATGKSVVEIAASKNVTKQQVISVITKTQTDVQFKGENHVDSKQYEQMLKNIEPIAISVIEHKTETPWINESVETVNSMKEPTPEEIQKVLEGKPTPSNIKVEGLFSLNGKPDYTADFYLNDENLLSILKINAQELKQELATGKSVVEIAASKNVTKQQVINVIAKTQTDGQFKGENNVDSKQYEQMLKNIEPKVIHVIEHKTETPW